MPKSQHSDSSSNPALTQLLEVDAQLADQEAHLSAQLQSIQEKRQSLKSVMDMFTPADAQPVVTPAPTPASDTNGKFEPSIEGSATQELDDAQATPTDSVAQKSSSRLNQKQKKTSTTASRKKQSAKPARGATKTAKRTQGWQDYLREEFSDVALPEAVSTVLQQQPKQALEIALVVDAIFDEEMPDSVRNKARDRVSNILAEGARKNKWYRADAGSYSMSASAT